MRRMKYLVPARFQFENQLMVSNFHKLATPVFRIEITPAAVSFVRKPSLAKVNRRLG